MSTKPAPPTASAPSHGLHAAIAQLRHLAGRNPLRVKFGAGLIELDVYDPITGVGISSECEATVNERAEIAVDGGLACSLIRQIPEHVPAELAVDGEALLICAAGLSYRLTAASALDDLPAPPPLSEQANSLIVPLTSLQDAMKCVQHIARAVGEGGGVIQNVALRGSRLIATDGHRLGIAPVTDFDAGDETILLPARFCQELLQLSGESPCCMSWDTRQARIAVGAAALTGRLGDGQYPNVDALVPAEFAATVTYRRDDFTASLGRLGLVAARSNGVLVMDVDAEGSATIQSEDDTAAGTEALAANDFQGAAIRFAFNAQYMEDAIKRSPGDEITLKISSPTSPFLVCGCESREGTIQLVMPVQLRGEGQ